MPRRPLTRRRWSSLRLLLAFQLAATAPVLGVGVVLDHRYQVQQTDETLRDAENQAGFIADLVIAPALGDEDLATADVATTQAALADLLTDPELGRQIRRVKVWDATGRIVASDSAELPGRTFADDDERHEAFDGETSAEVVDTADASVDDEHVAERSLGRAVEVYTPLHAVGDPSRITGVVEIYLPYAPLAADLQRSSTTLRRDLALGLLVIVVTVGAVSLPVLRRLHRQAVAAERAAVTDELTGLDNLAGLQVGLDGAFAAEHGATVVLADVAGLRQVNEALGHDAGSDLLRHVATRLRAAVSDLGGTVAPARTGGGEFEFVLPATVPADLPAQLARVRELVAHPVDLAGVPVVPRLALAAVRVPEQAATQRDLAQRLSATLVRAKQFPGGVACYDRAADPFDSDRLRLLTELPSAVADGHLRLLYQPQVDARSGRTRGVEALVRWQHPDRGLLGPVDFVPLAESSGLITIVTPWVVATAAAQQRLWREQTGVDLEVSVNVSARDLADPGFVDRTVRAVREAGVDPRWICLELTETAVLLDPVGARVCMEELTAQGFRCSLDDFGQGATSLSQLRDMPLHEIKLDRAFVTGLTGPDGGNAADTAIAASVVQLGHNLGLSVVAEGVETREQAAVLSASGYDVLQGWLLGRPVEPAVVAERVRAEVQRGRSPIASTAERAVSSELNAGE